MDFVSLYLVAVLMVKRGFQGLFLPYYGMDICRNMPQ
ncbi:Uncharacterised protein [Enterobacter hormaechei]|nr:Uncharacterised protein [Enterobacter hormaechei]SAB50967.1 Uncharacterised protein [Enterobacter hormaechei]SAC10176.1 Uncharacterised protein [Enterobacter hormaechei]SAE32282.1 Uncharacterised protein [Enterobacter hormaechei]SAE47039.1 Uncharacterised protein [Enterobacter hormaechei]